MLRAPDSTGLPAISTRLAQALLSLALAWCLAAVGAIWLVVHHEVDELLDHALQESAELLYGLLSLPATAQVLAQNPGGALPAPGHQENLVWQVVSADGQVLLHSHGAPNRPWHARAVLGLSDEANAWRLYGMALPGEAGRVLYVAQPHWERREAWVEAAAITALATTTVGLAGLVWLRRRLRQELQPLGALSAAVVDYDPLRHPDALPAASRAELLPLREAIHTLGQRLAQRVASERAFSAHAAHALRTPLAGIDAQLAVALRSCEPALQTRLTRVRSAAQSLQQVVVSLLALFRSSAEPSRQPIDLPALLQRLPVANLVVHTSGQAPLNADPDMLTAALANLLDNASKHGATLVQVHCQPVPGQADVVQLLVSDNGPGVDAELRQALVHELGSGRYARPLGLGLMLADLVARAHGGHASLPSVGADHLDAALAGRVLTGCTVVLTLQQSST